MAQTALRRQIWLLETIQRYRRITLKELQERWLTAAINEDQSELSRKTFNNHKMVIEEWLGIEICCNRSTNEYYIDNPEDIGGDSISSWVIGNLALENQLLQAKDVKNRILFEEIPRGQEYIIPIIEAIRSSQQIEMEYTKMLPLEERHYIVEPYFIKLFRQRWYLVAKKVETEEIRTFALDRIQRLMVLDKKFKYPSDFSPSEFLHYSYGIVHDNNPPETLKILATHNQANYLRLLPLHHTQEEVSISEEGVVFEYRVKISYDLEIELLSQMDHIEVLQPQWLRESIRDKLRESLDRYNLRESLDRYNL